MKGPATLMWPPSLLHTRTCRRGSDKPAPFMPTFVAPSNAWSGPFIMEGVNGRIVQLSNALATEPYGTDFKCVAAHAC